MKQMKNGAHKHSTEINKKCFRNKRKTLSKKNKATKSKKQKTNVCETNEKQLVEQVNNNIKKTIKRQKFNFRN